MLKMYSRFLLEILLRSLSFYYIFVSIARSIDKSDSRMLTLDVGHKANGFEFGHGRGHKDRHMRIVLFRQHHMSITHDHERVSLVVSLNENKKTVY